MYVCIYCNIYCIIFKLKMIFGRYSGAHKLIFFVSIKTKQLNTASVNLRTQDKWKGIHIHMYIIISFFFLSFFFDFFFFLVYFK